MNRLRAAVFFPTLLVMLAASCRQEVTGCEVARYAVSITVSDSVTGAGGPFTNVLGTATGVVHSDTSLTQLILPPSSGNGNEHDVQLGLQQPDTYQVTVKADGYQLWSKANVTAPPDNMCPDRPVNQHLNARLVKAP